MAQANMTIRLDESDKRNFSAICENIGLSASTAINGQKNSIRTCCIIHISYKQ